MEKEKINKLNELNNLLNDFGFSKIEDFDKKDLLFIDEFLSSKDSNFLLALILGRIKNENDIMVSLASYFDFRKQTVEAINNSNSHLANVTKTIITINDENKTLNRTVNILSDKIELLENSINSVSVTKH